MAIRQSIVQAIVQPIVQSITGGGGGGSVSNQNFDYGLLSIALAGARTITPDSGTITSIVIDSGNTGTIYDTTGDQIRLAAGKTATTLTLGCTATFSDASTDTFTSIVTGVADEYSVRTDAEWVTVEALLGGVGSNSVMFRTIGTYANGINLQPSAVTGTITLRGESNTSRANIQNLFMSGLTANGNLTVKWLDTSNPRANAFNAGIRYGGVGGTLTIQNCSGTGPFTPETNTDKGHYWAQITVINATGEPTIGESIAEGGGNSNEIFGFDDLGGNSYVIYFNDQVIGTAAAWLVADTLTETTTGETFEVSVVRSGGLPDAQTADSIASNGGGVVWNNITVIDCDYDHWSDGVNLKANDGLTVTRTIMRTCYRDAFKFNAVDFASPPVVLLTDLEGYTFYSNPTDFNNPHVDCIQFNGNSLTADWTGFIIDNCKFNIGDTRCTTIQGIFLEGIPSPFEYVGKVRNNLVVTKNTTHGVSFDRAKNCEIFNNTLVHADPDNASGEANVIAVRITTDGGGNIVQNNVADNINTPSATLISNVVLGQGGATIAYSDAFAPSTFTTPPTLSAAYAQYTPQDSGPLVAGVTYVVGDVGMIDSISTPVDWNSASIPATDMDVNFDSSTYVDMLDAADAGTITATKTFCIAGKIRLTDTASKCYMTAAGVDTYINIDTGMQVRGEDSASAQIFSQNPLGGTLVNGDTLAFVWWADDEDMFLWTGKNAVVGAQTATENYTAMTNNFKMPSMINAVNGAGGLSHDIDWVGGIWYGNSIPSHGSEQALWDLLFDSSNDWVPTSSTVGGEIAHFYQDENAAGFNALNGTTGTVTDV